METTKKIVKYLNFVGNLDAAIFEESFGGDSKNASFIHSFFIFILLHNYKLNLNLSYLH